MGACNAKRTPAQILKIPNKLRRKMSYGVQQLKGRKSSLHNPPPPGMPLTGRLGALAQAASTHNPLVSRMCCKKL